MVSGEWISKIREIKNNHPKPREARSYYEWDEAAYQADNTTGWVLETRPAPAE